VSESPRNPRLRRDFAGTPVIAELAEAAMAEKARGGRIFDLKLSYVAEAAASGELTATAGIVHAGRRTIVTECRIEAPDGRLIATASATFAVSRDQEN
jgi:uncharacterized protein (TIGR00369 family)